jgi:large subunit ribosomal protein L19
VSIDFRFWRIPVQNAIIDRIEKSQQKKRPRFSVGDKVTVSVRLKEGDKERIQAFKGVVISKHPKSGKGPNATFTVRKISEGVGVERIFPVHSPFIEKLEVESSSEVRRSRLYYLRALKGKKARLKESERFGDILVADETETVAASGTETGIPQTKTTEAPAATPAPVNVPEKK